MSKEDDFSRIFIMVLAFLVVFTIVVMLIARSVGMDENSGPMTDKDIDARTMPYGGVNLPKEAMEAAKAEPEVAAPVSAPEPAAEAPAMAAAPAIDGAALYAGCAACHDNGVAGAPRRGDKAAWAPRIARGMDSMVAVAISGKGAMPPKGGRMDYSDEQIKAVVDYMVNQSK